MTQATAAQLAALLQATIEGDPGVVVHRPMGIQEAQSGDLSFIDSPKYAPYAYTTGASVLLVSHDFVAEQPIKATLLRVPNVRASLQALLAYVQQTQQAQQRTEVSPQAHIHASAQIGADTSVGAFSIIEAEAIIGTGCKIHPQVYIGQRVRIGANTILYPGVRIMDDCTIGERCIIHSNAVIGADGFGFVPQPDQSWVKVPQIGTVTIEDDVEVGANTCIDRAALGSTTIRSGAKLDNLIHIAHNVEIGAHSALAAQVGVAGSARIGAHCLLGGQTGVAGHISLADGTRTQAQSGIGSAVTTPNTALFGSPAIAYNDYVRAYIVFKDLPALARRLRALEREKDPK
jgi:UDP-3-O-[3-hydroxymyristoyl] glucosamine N-acyltransferase